MVDKNLTNSCDILQQVKTPPVFGEIFSKKDNGNFMRRGRTTIIGKSKRRMKFRACGPFPAHALRSHAVPSETAHGAFAMLLHSKKLQFFPKQDRTSPLI